MTKVEIMKWLLFVGSQPTDWYGVVKKHPDSGGKAENWNNMYEYNMHLKFQQKFDKWQTSGFVTSETEKIKVDEGSSFLIRYYLTDKALAKLQGKRSKV